MIEREFDKYGVANPFSNIRLYHATQLHVGIYLI